MKNDAQNIADQIKALVDQLVSISSSRTQAGKVRQLKPEPGKKGAAGGISILIQEGFFDKPKDLPSVMAKLEQLGRYYPRPTVAMNLLNLTKKRTFNRIRDSKTKNWQYVLRK